VHTHVELRQMKAEELDADDPFFPLLVTVRATKAG